MTNNRLESINGKLKQVISHCSSLEEFITNFFVILSTLRTERDHKAVVMFQKMPSHPFADGSPESNYRKLLTSYAFFFIVKQIELSSKVKDIRSEGDSYSINTSSQGEVNVSTISCTCLFHKSMLLPCRHIFAVRNKLGMPLFDAVLASQRWMASYYRKYGAKGFSVLSS